MIYKDFESIEKNYCYNELVSKYNDWTSNTDEKFVYTLDDEYINKYSSLREEVLYKFKEYDIENIIIKKENKYKYKFDVMLGLVLHEVLNITEREASLDAYWEFLQLKIFPDIVMLRWNINKNKDRFIKSKKDTRIFFKQVWWYVHMILNTGMSIQEAKKILLGEGLNTDAVVAIVERTGKDGYDYKVNSEIIKAVVKADTSNVDRPVRRIMYVNSAQSKVLIPEFSEGGTEEYAKKIVNKIIEKNKR